ncbi:MAG: hypothetical protein FJZ98_08520, partial [Chloroflexi bacterium]|nr:hypothetical protein [Chloroflexota bacterium]
MNRFLIVFRCIFVSLVVLLMTATSVWQPIDSADRIRIFTREFEFDYLGWSWNALWTKISAASLGPIRHMSYLQQRRVLRDYFQTLADTQLLEESLESLYTDPLLESKPGEATILAAELAEKKKELQRISKIAETVIQDQISFAADELGLTMVNQPFPPVLYHVTDLPKNLVISPRDIIRQERSVSLSSAIELDDEMAIETAVEENTDYSALIVPVGGVGTYPTMVIRSNHLPSLLDTVAHEWIHNYLTLRPLGVRYATTPALRTMNETTANIAGEEISYYVLRKFYWDLLPEEQDEPYQTFEIGFSYDAVKQEESFNYRKEMYETRLRVDELLSQGKIKEAEEFMEIRRQVFWNNGYRIRKLNQAYFAFYGAYADQPFSAAGADPVGSDVRLLRSRSASLAEFIHIMSGLRSYAELKE